MAFRLSQGQEVEDLGTGGGGSRHAFTMCCNVIHTAQTAFGEVVRARTELGTWALRQGFLVV